MQSQVARFKQDYRDLPKAGVEFLMPKTSIMPKMNRFVLFSDIGFVGPHSSIRLLIFRHLDGGVFHWFARDMGTATKPVGNARLLNHLIRLDQDVLWYYKAKLLSRLEVDENLEF